jgi:hypothetical protein
VDALEGGAERLRGVAVSVGGVKSMKEKIIVTFGMAATL